ncbi:uncharacterized protein LOC144197284 [Stigmatopora nigra]
MTSWSIPGHFLFLKDFLKAVTDQESSQCPPSNEAPNFKPFKSESIIILTSSSLIPGASNHSPRTPLDVQIPFDLQAGMSKEIRRLGGTLAMPNGGRISGLDDDNKSYLLPGLKGRQCHSDGRQQKQKQKKNTTEEENRPT